MVSDEKNTDKLYRLFSDWISVIKGIDGESKVLESRIPLAKDFFEPNIRRISHSLLKYIDKLKGENKKQKENESDGDNDENGDDDEKDTASHVFKLAEGTTLLEKFANKEYNTVYELYHDLKASSIMKMTEVEDDPESYANVDKFFKVATEILLRECKLAGYIIESSKKDEREKPQKSEQSTKSKKAKDTTDTDEGPEKVGIDMETSLEQTLSQDFDMITATFIGKTSEALSLTATGNLPLFTSLNRVKSELDDREPIIDANLGVNVVKVVPNMMPVRPERMAFVTPQSQKILRSSNTVLENYMHPNCLWVTASQWLKHGDNDMNFTFAPSYDENRSTITNKWKGITWLQEAGFKEMKDLKQGYKRALDGNEKEKKVEEKKADDGDKKKTTDNEEESEDEPRAATHSKIDLANLFKWGIGNKIGEGEKDAIKNNQVQKRISQLLLELNELRKSRVAIQRQQLAVQQQFFAQQASQGINVYGAEYNVTKASKQEVEKYHEVKRLLTGLLRAKNVSPNKLNLATSKKLVISQHDYAGTLPASFVSANHYSRYGRGRRRR